MKLFAWKMSHILKPSCTCCLQSALPQPAKFPSFQNVPNFTLTFVYSTVNDFAMGSSCLKIPGQCDIVEFFNMWISAPVKNVTKTRHNRRIGRSVSCPQLVLWGGEWGGGYPSPSQGGTPAPVGQVGVP